LGRKFYAWADIGGFRPAGGRRSNSVIFAKKGGNGKLGSVYSYFGMSAEKLAEFLNYQLAHYTGRPAQPR